VDDLFGLVGTRLDGKYDVVETVAEGGFGVVYRGTHATLDRPVAVKVLKAPEHLQGNLRRAFLDCFSQEARTIARLEHPAIVKVLDFGASPMPRGDTAPWMVLEWLTGETLEAHLHARRGAGGRSPAEVLTLLRPIFEALANAHEENVAHRDIKPANVMIARSSRPNTGRGTGSRRGEPFLRILDFGIAKVMSPDEATGSGMTRTRGALVTFSLPYAAPEQVSGMRTGPWTDVHALGLLVTELLTDRAPYRGDELMDLHLDVLSPARPTPAKFGFDVGAWEPVLQRAVALRPGDRYQDAGEFLYALEESLPAATHTLVAATPSTTGRSQTLRPMVRPSEPPAPTGQGLRFAALGLVSLSLTIALGAWAVHRARTTRGRANDAHAAATHAPVAHAPARVTTTHDAALVRTAAPVERPDATVTVAPPAPTPAAPLVATASPTRPRARPRRPTQSPALTSTPLMPLVTPLAPAAPAPGRIHVE
jgi:serine/threonine protein kinase